MQNGIAFRNLATDTIHESTANSRRIFEESKLEELAESIRHHGLIQPITVRRNADGFELIAGVQRYRAAQPRLVNFDPYTFADEVAEEIAGEDEARNVPRGGSAGDD